MPIGDQVAEVLPVTVGGFERGRLPDGFRVPTGEQLHLAYRRGSDSVIVDASLQATAADARAAVDTAARETRDELHRTDRRQDLPRIVQDLRGDPAYVALSEFVAWSRGRYFFAARASSPHALAAFMKEPDEVRNTGARHRNSGSSPVFLCSCCPVFLLSISPAAGRSAGTASRRASRSGTASWPRRQRRP